VRARRTRDRAELEDRRLRDEIEAGHQALQSRVNELDALNHLFQQNLN
jgi:hypothetical protein